MAVTPNWDQKTNLTDDLDHLQPSIPRVRLVSLGDLMQQVDNEVELRAWIFDRAARGECKVYWRVPWPLCAFFDRRNDVFFSKARSETNADVWRERPEVRFVQLTLADAQQFKTHDAVTVASFRDGLFIPGDVAANTGLLEPHNFSGIVRVAHPSQPAPRAPFYGSYHPEEDTVTIRVEGLDFDDAVRDEIRDHFDDSPSQEITPYMLALGLKPGHRTKKLRHAGHPTTGTEPAPLPDPRAENHESEDDPYRLKGRCDGVYALYVVAARCGRNASYCTASKASERKAIAREVFDQLLDELDREPVNKHVRAIKKLYGATRRDDAIRLIDPNFNYNEGRQSEAWIDWPPSPGRALLDLPDEKRQPFVTDMLKLTIAGAELWLGFKATPPAGGIPMKEALIRWLQHHGVIGAKNAAVALAAITWKG